MKSIPAMRKIAIEAMPRRWSPVAAVTVATRKGARKAVTLPEKAKSPKYWVI
jgi:hypothetical protein